MKKAWLDFLKSLQPPYAVLVTMYHVIPGAPVQTKAFKENFGKGELEEAKKYYVDVVAKHASLGALPNTEIVLIRGRKRVIERKKFGPVDFLKTLDIA